LRAVAEECCRGRIVAVTEGGYDLEAFGTSLDATVATLSAPLDPPRWSPSGIASDRGAHAVSTVKQHLTAYWRL
jgi:acetoin utilization deacetylase AcuC-like enzyme